MGETKTAGWQFGLSRTVRVPVDEVWDYLVGPGLPVWLGVDALGEVGSAYGGVDGSGEVRSRTPRVRIRVTHRRPGQDHETTVQIGLRRAASGTTVVFHQERLAGPAEREEARRHWQGVSTRIADGLEALRDRTPRTSHGIEQA